MNIIWHEMELFIFRSRRRSAIYIIHFSHEKSQTNTLSFAYTSSRYSCAYPSRRTWPHNTYTFYTILVHIIVIMYLYYFAGFSANSYVLMIIIRRISCARPGVIVFKYLQRPSCSFTGPRKDLYTLLICCKA